MSKRFLLNFAVGIFGALAFFSVARGQVIIEGGGSGGGGTTITGYTDGGVPVAGAGGDLWQFDATLEAMDGSDTIGALVLGLTNANHTGSSNLLYGFYADTITGDAQAGEYAFVSDSGWDAEFVAVSNEFRLRALGVTYTAFRFQTNSGAGFAGLYDNRNGGKGIFTSELQSNGVGGQAHFWANAGFSAMNGSDEVAFFGAEDFTDANHTTGSNVMHGVQLPNITTPDADSEHYAITIGDGWEFAINGENALGTDDWTTANDKSGNTAAGTIKVEINGTLYHIQLYTDS